MFDHYVTASAVLSGQHYLDDSGRSLWKTSTAQVCRGESRCRPHQTVWLQKSKLSDRFRLKPKQEGETRSYDHIFIFQNFSPPSKGFPTSVGEAEDAGGVSVPGGVQGGYPTSKVPPDVVDVVVPVHWHGHGVGRTHRPQGLADRPPHLSHLT